MPFQLLDLILVAIMLVSGLLALMRGFTREVLSLVAWGCAAAAAFFAIHSQSLLDLANQYIKPEIAAKIAVAGGVPMYFPPMLIGVVAVFLVVIAMLSGFLSLGILKNSQPADLLR